MPLTKASASQRAKRWNQNISGRWVGPFTSQRNSAASRDDSASFCVIKWLWENGYQRLHPDDISFIWHKAVCGLWSHPPLVSGDALVSRWSMLVTNVQNDVKPDYSCHSALNNVERKKKSCSSGIYLYCLADQSVKLLDWSSAPASFGISTCRHGWFCDLPLSIGKGHQLSFYLWLTCHCKVLLTESCIVPLVFQGGWFYKIKREEEENGREGKEEQKRG